MILQNAVAIMKRLGRAAMKSDRSPEEVDFIASVDAAPLSAVKDAADVSFRFFGLDRIDGARGKIMLFREVVKAERYGGVQWHMTGPLRMNDVREAVSLFDLIHAVDSADLARRISREAKLADKIQRILVRVSMTGTQGFTEEGLFDLLEKIRNLENLKIEGLETMAPFSENIEKGRPLYRRLFELRKEAEVKGHVMQHLSMGGNHDFEVGIEEGATLVQVGAVLFGEPIC